MAYEEIPDDLKRFILTSIVSVPHLETLLLFQHHSDQKWDARGVSRNIYISEKVAKELLDPLCEAGFLVTDAGKEPLYWYSPRTEQQEVIVRRLAEFYRKELISVTNLIHSKAGSKIKQFADAFKIKKD